MKTQNKIEEVVDNSKSKYAIFSFVSSIITISILILRILFPQLFYSKKYDAYGKLIGIEVKPSGTIANFWIFFIAPILCLMAIDFGILGIKSIKRKYAIIGIILSTIIFLIWFCFVIIPWVIDFFDLDFVF
jgi:hypothetical protein